MSRQTKTPEPVLYADWYYARFLTPALVATVVYLTAAVLAFTDVHAWWVAACGAGVALLAPMIATGFGSPLGSRWFAFLFWAAIGAYLTWTAAGTPFSRDAVMALVPPAGVFGVWWHWIKVQAADAERARHLADDQAAAHATAVAELGLFPAMLELPATLARIGAKGVTEKDRIPFPAGFTVRLRMPLNGDVTYAKLRGLTDKLEVATDARPGALVFEQGESAAEVLLHVFQRDVLAETIPLPFDRRPKSISEPMPLGEYATGAVTVLTFREIAAMMVGLKGSGKSALLNTQLAHLTGCADAVVWMIDGKGGRTVRPWLQPFLDATTGRPAVDWAATTLDEADAMLLASNLAIEYRSTGDGEKIDPSPSTPAIILIVEEASLITGVGKYGSTNRAQMAERTVVTGRSEAVWCELATQRGTVTMVGNGDMKSQFDVRIGLGVQTADDARMIFPDGAMAESLFKLGKERKYRGAFLMQSPESSRVMASKGYWTDPVLIPGMALTNSQYRADLDSGTADFVHAGLVTAGVDGGYHGRWDRFRAQLAVSHKTGPHTSQTAASGTPDGTASGTPGGTGTGTSGGTGSVLTPNPNGATLAERLGLPGTSPTPSSGTGPSDVERDRQLFEEIVSHLKVPPPADIPTEERDDPQVVPPILLTLVQIFNGRGAEQLHTETILEHLPGEMTKRAFSLLMGHCGVAALPEAFVVDGVRRRGYALQSILVAIGKARLGGMPRQAFDWPEGR